MVRLMTLKGLESIAEREFKVAGDKLVSAIADREGIPFNDLRPYLVSLYCVPGSRLDVTFVIPNHTPIKFCANHLRAQENGRPVAELKSGRLVGDDYEWFAYRRNHVGSPCFTGARSLGHALLISRWAYNGDERAGWL